MYAVTVSVSSSRSVAAASKTISKIKTGVIIKTYLNFWESNRLGKVR